MCVTILVKSMTGYGRAQETLGGYDILIEIKSVNHRYFEFYSRIPRVYGYLEDKLKQHVHGFVSRGKVEVFVGITAVETEDANVHINHALAKSYLSELNKLADSLNLENDMTVSKLARFSDIFVLRRLSEDENLIWSYVKQVTDQALAQFLDMRISEGDKMREDILSRLDIIEGYVDDIDARSPEIVTEWRERLYSKISEVLESQQIDESRLITEAAIFAEKIAVAEETVRLKSHISQFRSILSENEPVGRKLDFLAQEINRETNTIGSKAQDTETSKIVVEMKSEAEKIREQIQNIE